MSPPTSQPTHAPHAGPSNQGSNAPNAQPKPPQRSLYPDGPHTCPGRAPIPRVDRAHMRPPPRAQQSGGESGSARARQRRTRTWRRVSRVPSRNGPRTSFSYLPSGPAAPEPAFAPCPHPFPFGTAAIPRPNRPRPPARGAAARRRASLAAGRRLHSCVRGPRRSKRTAGASRRFPPSFPSRPSMQARPAGSTARSCLVRRPCVALVRGGRRGGAARAWGGRHGVLLLLPLVGVALLFVASRPTPCRSHAGGPD